MTENIKIKDISEIYVKEYAKAVSSNWYNKYQKVKYSKKQSMEDLEQRILENKKGRFVITTEEGKFVGGIAILENKEDLEISIAYFIIPEYQKKGYASAALMEVTREIKRKSSNQIVLYIMTDNKASVKTANKCGYYLSAMHDGVSRYVAMR